MPVLIKDAGLFDSPQHFFSNYLHNLVQQLVLEGPDHSEQQVPLYEDKNLRQVQILLLHNVASGFDKCKFLKDEHGGSARDQVKEVAKPKKPHHDKEQIAAITAMGFDEAIAKKALKAAGDVSNAVTLLLESSFNIDGVSDSEEEVLPSDEQLKAEEEEKKQAELELDQKRQSLISVAQFKEFVKVAQDKGLQAVSNWSTFPTEKAQIIPLKAQRKYVDLYDQYIISLVRSPNQSQDDLTKVFDKIFSDYAKNVQKIEDSSSLNIDQITALYHDTKNKLSLIHRLTKIENYESILRSQRKDSLSKLIENVVKTIKAITSSNIRTGAVDKQNFYYISNAQELLYKSLLLLLSYLTILNSKKIKYENALIENEKKAGDVTTKKAKLKSIQKKLEDLSAVKCAVECSKFQQKMASVRISKKYSKELNILSGQIEDISRSILIQVDSDPIQIPVVTNTMTSGTSTLNIIQIQKKAYNEQRVQSQMEDIIKKMLEVKARKIAQFNKKEEAEEITEIQQKDSLIDFKTFTSEFQAQVLGIGKGPVSQNQNRWGGQAANVQQYLSQPSNELANQHLTKIFKKAISTTCDLIVMQNKSQAQEELVKDMNLKETLLTSRIQLKSEIVDQVNKKVEIVQAPNNEDAVIYKTFVDSLSKSTQPWFDELQSLKPCGLDSFENWKELSLVELRNLSSLARVYVDQESGILKEMIEGENILEWFRNVYLPIRLLNRKEEETEVKYELEQSATIDSLDKNICLFLNEITGYGHLYCDKAKEQRIIIRNRLLTACLESLKSQAQNEKGIKDLTVLEQAQLVSSLMIIQHLTNQYNQFEYNRVLLSRSCYSESITMLFNYTGSQRFVQIINSILGQVIKIQGQNLSTLLIERTLKIFTTIALFLEGEKKRDRYLKETAKRQKELAKKKAEEKKKKAEAQADAPQTNAPVQAADDALMNAESEDDDDDIHGEGSLSQQQPIPEDPEEANEEEEEVQDYGDQDPEEEDQDEDDMEDDDQGIIIQQQVNMHEANALMIDEEEEEEDELIAVEEHDEEGDEMDADEQEDDEFDDDADYDLPDPSEDLGMLFAGIGNRHRGGGRPAAGARDILFNVPEAGAPGDRIRIERPGRLQYGYEMRLGGIFRAAEAQQNFGPNWSQEEEEVSQTLRNLRGISNAAPETPPRQVIQQPPVRNSQQETCRYRIELEICKQFLDQQSPSALAKKSIEQIKLEQSKPQNNQISSIFEILKPIDLQGLGQLAQLIDQEFLKGVRSREDQLIDDEKILKKERLEKIKRGEQLTEEEIKAQELLEDCEYADDEDSEEQGANMSISAASFYPQTGLFRDYADANLRGEQPDISRLMDMRMDIERILHAQLLDPSMPPGFEDDHPLGLGGIFGVPPGYPPRQPARDRERVNQANAQRVAREQAVNWASSIYRVPEISAIENTQNMMQGLIEGGNVVYEIVEQPEPVADLHPSESASSSLRSASIHRSQEEAKNSESSSRLEHPLPHLRDINSVLADLQVGQNSPNTQAIQGDGQNALNSFFSSLNEIPLAPLTSGTSLVHPLLPQQIDGEALLGGMGGINQALDEIRNEMQTNLGQLTQSADRVVNANLPEQPQPQPEPVEQDEILGSALLDDEPQPEEAKQEPAQAQAVVERTYGFPNSLLIENDIDPEMLHEFPEELRVEILSTIQDQLEQWERDNSPNQQQQPGSEQPMSQDNSIPGQDQPAQAQAQPQPVEEEMDPEVAQAIAMGLDPDFIANIPPEMRRELIFNESFRAANTGAPIPPPSRAPEAMDVASIIATAQDPVLRREMLLSLSSEQIDQLPPALRGEAENLRRGGGRIFAQNPAGIQRQPRNIEQAMMGENREELERQMGLFLNRYNRNYQEGDPIKKQAPNPRDMPFDILMIDNSFEMDQQLQDKALESEKLIDKIQGQMLSSDSSNIDQLLKHILTAICLNTNVKTDIIQLLRLILKYKVDNGYPCRNQIVNALTFVMKISAQKDTQRLLNMFEIEIPENKKDTVIISDLQWNQIFLTVIGVLRVLIDNNKKLIMHMLKCLIQREDYFVSKGDHLVSSHASVLVDDSEKIPPLAQIIQIMREQSELHHALTKKQNQSEAEKVICSQLLVRIRNVKLLIQDAFKQFDLLFKEIDFAAKNGSPIINLGELSPESVKSLTDLLYLPSIDKKLLTALGDFMFRLSNLSDTAKCQEKNQRNWTMISKQCEIIGKTNVTDLNNLMLDALMKFGSFDVDNVDLNRVSSIIERSHSQMSSGANNQIVDPKPSTSVKITPEQEQELKDFLNQFRMDSAPIKHILSLNSFFFTKFTEEKEKMEKKDKTEELKVLIKQKEDFIKDIKQFFRSDEVSMLVAQINKMLIIVQQSGTDQIEHIKVLINLVFDCFMPEMHDEVVKAQKPKDKRDQKEEEDSKYVSMEPIPKIVAEESDAVMEGESSSLVPVQQTTAGSKKSKKLIFRDVQDASTRLYQFNNFCLQNQQILNKLVKNIYGSQNQRERDRERESKSKDIATVSEYIKFMPNLLDFENKRIYFKKEIKKMKRNVNARPLILMIRRSEIFMDSYSQLHYLSPNELKGKLSVDFSGERGQDVGGLTRDFFIELSREMFNQNYSLFKGSDNGSTYMPNQKSDVQPDHIRYFKFIGRVIGKALFEGCNLECYFVKSMYKMMIGQRLNFKDLEDYDNNLYTGLNWCLQPSSDAETLYETFSTQLDFFGRTEEIDLIKGGRDIDVTNENKEYYVERKAYFHLYKSVQKQMDAFLEGFYEIIPQDLVSIFTYKELELLISGLPDYQISDLRANTNYNGYNRNSPQIVWFWEIMESFDREEKGNLLQFVTGSSKVPVEGFALLQGMNGPEKFQITRIIANDVMRLPQGHTCFNQLDLPEYASKEIMRERLMWAIKETAGFGFA